MSTTYGSPALDRLYAVKFQKLKHQSSLSKKMHDMLSKHGGLNDSTFQSMKSINAAIAVAKQPGYFDYYTPPDDIKMVEEKKGIAVVQTHPIHNQLYTIHCTLYTIHYTLHTIHYTLYTIH